MTFTVTWRLKADYELAERWVTADSEHRAAISAALAILEDALRHRPNHVGEPNAEAFRIAIAPPVTLHYRVREADRVVEVLAIHID
ncbi:MAG TPA: hypothetical protein VMP01_21990 [Pirellulaceae bacterium]|nr:hypothetical protein [Pirellulaceae bacterium]